MNTFRSPAPYLLGLALFTVPIAPVFAQMDKAPVAENPLDDIGTLQDPLLVVSNGRMAVDRLNFGKK